VGLATTFPSWRGLALFASASAALTETMTRGGAQSVRAGGPASGPFPASP